LVAFVSACSNLVCKSAICCCKAAFDFSAPATASLCEPNCSLNLASSFVADFNLASEFLASVCASSKSLRK